MGRGCDQWWLFVGVSCSMIWHGIGIGTNFHSIFTCHEDMSETTLFVSLLLLATGVSSSLLLCFVLWIHWKATSNPKSTRRGASNNMSIDEVELEPYEPVIYLKFIHTQHPPPQPRSLPHTPTRDWNRQQHVSFHPSQSLTQVFVLSRSR